MVTKSKWQEISIPMFLDLLDNMGSGNPVYKDKLIEVQALSRIEHSGDVRIFFGQGMELSIFKNRVREALSEKSGIIKESLSDFDERLGISEKTLGLVIYYKNAPEPFVDLWPSPIPIPGVNLPTFAFSKNISLIYQLGIWAVGSDEAVEMEKSMIDPRRLADKIKVSTPEWFYKIPGTKRIQIPTFEQAREADQSKGYLRVRIWDNSDKSLETKFRDGLKNSFHTVFDTYNDPDMFYGINKK